LLSQKDINLLTGLLQILLIFKYQSFILFLLFLSKALMDHNLKENSLKSASFIGHCQLASTKYFFELARMEKSLNPP